MRGAEQTLRQRKKVSESWHKIFFPEGAKDKYSCGHQCWFSFAPSHWHTHCLKYLLHAFVNKYLHFVFKCICNVQKLNSTHSLVENDAMCNLEKKHDLPLLFSLFVLPIQSQVEMERHLLLILLASLMTRKFWYLKQFLDPFDQWYTHV